MKYQKCFQVDTTLKPSMLVQVYHKYLNLAEPKGVTFFEIIWHVKLECFLWGFGTAIGELPPYFVSRAAGMTL
jgi:hypothetical protein